MKVALILFSHGSLLCGSGEALDTHAARLRLQSEFAPVEIGYMNYSEPTFAEAVAKCVAAGAGRIVVLPFFLVPGFFVTKTLPEQLADVQALYPNVQITVADALGYHPALADALIESAHSAQGSAESWRDDLQAAARGCRAKADCPLYGTPNCPRVPLPNTPVRKFVE